MSAVVKVLQPSGILDGTHAGDFRQEISKIIESNVDIVLVDFQDITFMDSSGLESLILALKTVDAAGSKLYLCSLNEQIKMLLEMTSEDRTFEIFPTREDFENAIDS